DGSVQLVDPLDPTGTRVSGATDEGRALGLLRQATALALEGGRYRSGMPVAAFRAPVPRHASRVLDRLLGDGVPPAGEVASIVAALKDDADRPTEVDVARRMLHLGLAAPALILSLAALLSVSYPSRVPRRLDVWLVVLWPLACVLWAAATRGGLLLRAAGVAL